jgi:putative FmdB family regulatory protein
MPTYRYECASCAKVHEIFHSISEEPLKTCPECGGELSRLIGSGGGVILKGGGFYTTEYRSDSYKKEEKKDKEARTGKTESKKTDSKTGDKKGKTGKKES